MGPIGGSRQSWALLWLANTKANFRACGLRPRAPASSVTWQTTAPRPPQLVYHQSGPPLKARPRQGLRADALFWAQEGEGACPGPMLITDPPPGIPPRELMGEMAEAGTHRLTTPPPGPAWNEREARRGDADRKAGKQRPRARRTAAKSAEETAPRGRIPPEAGPSSRREALIGRPRRAH